MVLKVNSTPHAVRSQRFQVFRTPTVVNNNIIWVLSLKRAKQQTPNLHDESSNLSGPAYREVSSQSYTLTLTT